MRNGVTLAGAVRETFLKTINECMLVQCEPGSFREGRLSDGGLLRDHYRSRVLKQVRRRNSRQPKGEWPVPEGHMVTHPVPQEGKQSVKAQRWGTQRQVVLGGWESPLLLTSHM